MKKQEKVKFCIISALLLVSLASCKKDCFDQALYNQYQNAACTLDCPGVIGCDGKTYCNTCEANRNGIRVE